MKKAVTLCVLCLAVAAFGLFIYRQKLQPLRDENTAKPSPLDIADGPDSNDRALIRSRTIQKSHKEQSKPEAEWRDVNEPLPLVQQAETSTSNAMPENMVERHQPSENEGTSGVTSRKEKPKKVLRSAVSPEGVTETMRELLPDIRECYTEWLAVEKERSMDGQLKFEIKIDVDKNDPSKGKVSKYRILDSDLNHPFLEACVRSVVSTLKFKAPPETVTISYPIVFQSE